MSFNALLALEDGTLFPGSSIGIDGEVTGEVVFNTSMTGYQEILTDPSYCKQIVTLTHPHIGNVGTNPEDEESGGLFISGLVIRDLPFVVSNWRSSEGLDDYLKRHNIIAIADIDTRQLTRHLRKNGAMKACLVAGDAINSDTATAAAKSFPGLVGMDLAKVVSTKKAYSWNEASWSLTQDTRVNNDKKNFHVIAYDFGVKRNILRLLLDQGCEITVVPANTPAEDVLAAKPDGVFLSNGPGDPEPCDYAINAIKTIIAESIPIFGICLGHQLLCLALNAKTIKMKFGHHGANHPVQELKTGQVLITSQNHGFAVDEASLPSDLLPTHRSLFDSSLQGVHHSEKPVFGFQGHPEASPGPHDIQQLFTHFTELMKAYKS